MSKETDLKVQFHRSGQGEPFVLLHCLGVDRALWAHAGLNLLQGFEQLAYDFPGHGSAPVPSSGYSIEDLAQALHRAVQAEGISQVSLCGISLGGLAAQCLAADHPELVSKLVLVDTTPRYTDEMRTVWHNRAGIARRDGVAAMIPHLLEVWFTPDYTAAEPPAVQYVKSCFRSASGEGYALACEALAGADLIAGLSRIQARTLIVCGDGDLPSFIEAANKMHAEIKNSEMLWLAPARHASILEQPKAFATGLAAFLAS
jgi:3-oxoadipate enol-lactonase